MNTGFFTFGVTLYQIRRLASVVFEGVNRDLDRHFCYECIGHSLLDRPSADCASIA